MFVAHPTALWHCGSVRATMPVGMTDTTGDPQDCGDDSTDWASMKVTLFVSNPKSKSNYTFSRKKGSYSTAKWEVVKNFEQDLKIKAKSTRPKGWPLGVKGSKVDARPAVCVAIYARSLIDTGNLSKSALDALEGVLYHTDASVRYLCEASVRASQSDGQAMTVTISVHPPGTDPSYLIDTASDHMREAMAAMEAKTGKGQGGVPPK